MISLFKVDTQTENQTTTRIYTYTRSERQENIKEEEEGKKERKERTVQSYMRRLRINRFKLVSMVCVSHLCSYSDDDEINIVNNWIILSVLTGIPLAHVYHFIYPALNSSLPPLSTLLLFLFLYLSPLFVAVPLILCRFTSDSVYDFPHLY